jgi:hypothetical protein
MEPETIKCKKDVWDKDSWHSHVCNRPAKYMCGRGKGKIFARCGVHARQFAPKDRIPIK